MSMSLAAAIENEFANQRARTATLAMMDGGIEKLSTTEKVYAYLCPGCQGWQIEHRLQRVPIGSSRRAAAKGEREARAAVHAAVAEHRRECGAFDMLAGLQGVPAIR